MFAIPILGLRHLARRPPAWLRIASLSGFMMTLLYVVLSIFPIIPVESRVLFAFKIVGLILVTNLAGCLIFAVAQKERS